MSFIAADRMAALPPDTVFPQLAPDLAIEVLSPSDGPRRVQDKVGECLEAGVRGEDVVPGFRCALSELLS